MSEIKKNYLSANYFNDKQIDSICNVLTDIYTEKKFDEGVIINRIDIDEFVEKILGAKIVYESIDASSLVEVDKEDDCVGFCSDGVQAIPVIRNGKTEWIVFPKDTIVIDKYLKTDPKLANHRRFCIAHEAGHIIKNRMTGKVQAEFNHAGGVVLTSAPAMKKRYSYHEVEANKFAASLLMPEAMVAMLMLKLYDGEKIVKYQGDILSHTDVDRISYMAKVLGVAYETMYYRLKQMGHLVDGILETYVEENVVGANPNE